MDSTCLISLMQVQEFSPNFFSFYVPVGRGTAFELFQSCFVGWLSFPIPQDVSYCYHDLKNLALLGKTIILQGVPAQCGVTGNDKDDFLAKKGVLVTHKVSSSTSFYSIKNLTKRSTECRDQEDIKNCVSHKSWRNVILNLSIGPRRRAIVKFRLATGRDCL
ncbi:hypothetical protein TNIN_232041 [Trichonephila inaurata madagascariensis]|uniref:Uncharacterized protein n=1 Tax=Trichonephila inaurata madagascariensis TaxID=2747483 RepID=A0A8X6X6P1_9ARAC|nr:hypothetical protein TNIN_232041 [Trichonephila inaurata madagascariensis]